MYESHRLPPEWYKSASAKSTAPFEPEGFHPCGALASMGEQEVLNLACLTHSFQISDFSSQESHKIGKVKTRNVMQIELVQFKKNRGWQSVLPIGISKIWKRTTVTTYTYNRSQNRHRRLRSGTRTEGRPYKHTWKRWASASQEERLQKKAWEHLDMGL